MKFSWHQVGSWVCMLRQCLHICCPSVTCNQSEVQSAWPVDKVPLTPSLPKALKFPGWKMHSYIFRSYSTSTFSAIHFYDNHFACQCKKTKRVKGFRFYTFTGLSVMALKGLTSFCPLGPKCSTCQVLYLHVHPPGLSLSGLTQRPPFSVITQALC